MNHKLTGKGYIFGADGKKIAATFEMTADGVQAFCSDWLGEPWKEGQEVDDAAGEISLSE